MATIETLYDYKNNLTLHKVEGILTFEETKNKIEEYYQGTITKYTLWEFTKAEVSKISTSEIQEIVKVARKFAHMRKGGRTALVLHQDLSYGLGRMFEAFSEIESIPYEIRCFRGFIEAREWLNEEQKAIFEGIGSNKK